jgi:uncharacterized tellurite resistance protein B-like protein
MLFGRARRKRGGTEEVTSVVPVVRTHLKGADEATLQIVAAIAGLLGAVAYADREVRATEWQQLEQELARIRGLDAAGIRAVSTVLREHIVSISTAELPYYTRALREHASRELRVEILGLLLDLAAADGTVTVDEVNLLRTTASALGLSQQDYNEAQTPHRDKLSVLQPGRGSS